MNGHYHLELEVTEEDGPICINNESLPVAIEKAKATGRKVVGYGFVCRFGCGLFHAMTDGELTLLMHHFPYLPASANKNGKSNT